MDIPVEARLYEAVTNGADLRRRLAAREVDAAFIDAELVRGGRRHGRRGVWLGSEGEGGRLEGGGRRGGEGGGRLEGRVSWSGLLETAWVGWVGLGSGIALAVGNGRDCLGGVGRHMCSLEALSEGFPQCGLPWGRRGVPCSFSSTLAPR